MTTSTADVRVPGQSPRLLGLRLLLTLAGASLIVASAVGGPPSLAWLGMMVQLAVLLGGDAEAAFPTIITWGLTAPSMLVEGRSVFALFAMIAIVKVAYAGFRRPIGPGLFVSGFALVVLQFVGEVTGSGPALQVVTVTSMLLLFIAIGWFYDWSRIDLGSCRLAFIGTALLCIAGSLVAAGGDWSQFVVASDDTTRLGEASRGLGGALGIPIYALASITLVVLSDLRGKLPNRIASYLLVAIFTLAGLLTISRVFILGYAVLIIAVFLNIFTSSRRAALRVLISLAGVGVVGGLLFQSEVSALAGRLAQRTADAGLDSGRLAIFDDALLFLSQNPHVWATGQGAIGYVSAGQTQNSLVGSMMHNLLFDVVFSWGAIGAVALIALLVASLRRAANTLGAPIDRLALLPGLVVGACLMTGGSLWYFSTYVFLWVATVLGLDGRAAVDGNHALRRG